MNLFSKFTKLDLTRQDFWRYAAWLPAIPKHCRVDTQQPAPTPLVRAGEYWLKREDESAVGSHKYRSLAWQLSQLLNSGQKQAVLSSSGNAAIAASHLAKTTGIKLLLLLARETPPAKLAAIEQGSALVVLSRRALSLGKWVTAKYGWTNLRPSANLASAAIGFRTLGLELAEQNPNLNNIFTFITSGASLLGVGQAYELLVQEQVLKQMPRLFGVYSRGELAGECAAKNLERLTQSAELCVKTGGKLIEVSDEQIRAAAKHLDQLGWQTAAEGAASYAAADEEQPAGESAVILSGRVWPASPDAYDLTKSALQADTPAELAKIIEKNFDV